MSGRYNLKKTTKRINKQKANELTLLPATLGLPLKNVKVPGREGYHYARIRGNLSELVEVYNPVTTPVYDWPVIITYRNNRWEVVETDTGRYITWGDNNAIVGVHGSNHFLGQGDTIYIDTRQIVNSLVYAVSGTAINVNAGLVNYQNDIVFVEKQTIDLLSYQPTGSGAIWAIVRVDNSGTVSIQDDMGYVDSVNLLNYYNIPNIADNYIGLAAVRLWYGQTELDRRPNTSDVVDLRYIPDYDGANTGSSGVTDHGLLTGLLDNDHPQYLLTGTAISSTDEKVKVSSNDTTAGYLNGKLVEGAGISLTEVGDGGNETFRISYTGTSTGGGGGGSYPVIYDDSVYKVTGSAISFDTGLTVAVTGSTAFVTAAGASIGTHIYIASQNGAAINTDLTTGGGTDDTAALQAILNQATGTNSPIMLVMDGPSLVSGLNIYSNTTIHCLDGAGFYLNSGSNRAIIRNAHRSRTTITDEHITIIGGYYNGNRSQQVGAGTWPFQEADDTFMSAMQFFGVNYLILKDLEIYNQRAFGANIGNANDVYIENYYCDFGDNSSNGSDGLHLNGPISRLYANDLRIHSWDDALTISAGDDSAADLTIANNHGPYVGQGLIEDVLVDGLQLIECLEGMRFLSHDSNSRINRVKVKNVSGDFHNHVATFSSFNVGVGDVGTISLEGVAVEELTSYPASGEPDPSLIKIQDWTSVEHLVLRDITITNPIDTRSLIWVHSDVSVDWLTIDDFHIHDTDNNATGLIPIQVDGAIGRLNGRDLEWFRIGALSRGGPFFSLTNASSHIGALILNNVFADAITNIVRQTNGVIDGIQADQIRNENDDGNATFYSTAGTGTAVVVSNWFAGSGIVWTGTSTALNGDAFGTKVSFNDTKAGFLNGKLVEGAGVSLTEVNNGANETLRISYTGTAGVTDHGALTGLSDNDHPQYVLTGTVSGGGHTIQDDGVNQTQRTNMNFVGAGFVLWDDAGNGATIVSGTSVPGIQGPQGETGPAGLPGGNTLYYDDGVFKVTGTAVSFDGGLDVAVTGSIAYVSWTGSSSGAPTSSEYVTTAADGSLSAEVVIPGLAGSPDIAGAGGGGITEEYDTSSTNLSWDTAPAAEDSDTTVKSHLYVSKTTTSTSLGIRAWTPGAGAFDARTKVALGVEGTSAATGQMGLYIQNSDQSVRAFIRFGFDTTNKRYMIDVFTYQTPTYTQRASGWYYYTNYIYLRITRDGSNNLSFYVSQDGILWRHIITQALTLTVSHIGYYFNHDGGATAMYAISDWLRTDH